MAAIVLDVHSPLDLELNNVYEVAWSGASQGGFAVVGTAALCYAMGMSIFAVIAVSCVFVPCLFAAVVLTFKDKTESGEPLNPHFQSIGAIACLAVAMLTEPQVCFWGLAGRVCFWFIPRILLLGHAVCLLNNPSIADRDPFGEDSVHYGPPPPYTTN